jgi:putative tricarboxylic transport membrane protein
MGRADLVTGLVLFALSIAVIYGAWTMPRLEIRQIHPLSAPGLTPGLLGIALALTSLMLIGKAATSGRTTATREDEDDEANPGAGFRLATAAVLCLVYALGLIGRMPFWLATTLFVTVAIAVFEWDRGGTHRERAVRLAWAVFLGIATGVAVSYIFRDLFLVRLP